VDRRRGSRSTGRTITSGVWKTSSPSSPQCGVSSTPNKEIGGLFPNDADGNAWGDPVNGVPPAFKSAGYNVTDPGRYQDLTDDFSAQITAFKNANAEIVTGVVLPPDFTTFRNQANQQNFKPKAITVGKAILFPESVEVLGAAGHNLSSEV
jgi:branched-chain amino acid transport system substrate-binding protein